MPRGNGSYTGFDASPNANVASGIWTVREAETLLRANKWPATPTVPGAPSGTAGDGQVSLTWTAPTGGSAVTDYEVQYSSDAGSTWTTFSDGVSTATSATVTGLTNGTGYIFRVRAVNILGEGPYGSASGTITPSALNVVLLLNFNGNNGDTSTTDASPEAHAVTFNGSAEISTAQSKFGGSSLYLDGSSTVSVPASAVFDFGTDDWTIEAWVYPVNFTPGVTPHGLICAGGYPSGWAHYTDGGSGNLSMNSGSPSWGGSDPGPSPPDGVWSHLALVVDGGTARAFVDGTQVGSFALSGRSFDSNNEDLVIGDDRASGSVGLTFEGYIDSLRIVKGTAVYTANFTPPTSQF